jgi:HEAT repeat protein
MALTVAIGIAQPGVTHAQSLDATDATELASAIEAAGHAGDRAGATALAARIDQGLPAPLLSRAIDALARNGTPPAISALVTLCGHRRAAVRAEAARALTHGQTTAARRVLADLLDDPDAAVRSAAAVALGEVGARGVLDTVMLAALRGVTEAAILFGRQASAADVARLLRSVDASSLEQVAPALRVVLQRTDVARPSKLAVVRRLGELGGVLAQQILREVGAALPEGDPIAHAIDDVLAAAAPDDAPAGG